MLNNCRFDGGPILLPRLTTSERNAVDASEGMIIYNTDDLKAQIFSPLFTSYGTTPTGTGGCLESTFQPFTPTQNLVILSVEFHDFDAGNIGSVKIFTGDPCETESIVITSTNSITSVEGWNKYSFPSPIQLQAGITYYFGSDSGEVCSDFSNLNDEPDDPLFGKIVDTLTLNCLPLVDKNFAITVNYYSTLEWQNLH